MEKKDKIIVGGLIVVILALLAGLAVMTGGGNLSNGDMEAEDGMQIYDFDSQFTMQVPDDAKFIKEWNSSVFDSTIYSYLDISNRFAVIYVNAPMFNEKYLDMELNRSEASGNISYEKIDDNHIKVNHLKHNGEISKSIEKCNFTNSIMFHKGHIWIDVQGNDANQIEKMVNTLRLYGE